jgi:hypothetical protein
MDTSIKVRALKQWINKNGPDAVIPAGHQEVVGTTPISTVRLDRFVSTLRKNFREGTVDVEIVKALDGTQFQWSVSRGPRSTADLRTRNAQIMELRRRKQSLAEIADHFDLSRQRVHQIIKAASK